MFELNKAETMLKQLCETYPELKEQIVVQPEELVILSNKMNVDFHHLLELPLNPKLIEETFFNQNEDIAIFRHIRYLPALYHSHSFFEMIYVVNGHCQNYIDDTTITLTTGDICIIAPHSSHAISAFSDDAVIYNFLIRTSTFDTAFLGILVEKDVLSTFFTHALYANKKCSYLIFHTAGDKYLKDFIDFTYAEFISSQKYKSRMINNLLKSTFILLLRNHEKDVVFPRKDGKADDGNLMYILNYIQANYTHITLTELARFFNYSDRHMSRLIKESSGLSFSEMIRELKIHKSADLLKNPDISIAEVIECVGYSDLSSFYRTFKSYYGLTPVEYRNKA